MKKTLLSYAVSRAMFNSAVKGSKAQGKPGDGKDFKPVLRFTVCSDSHIQKPGDGRCKLVEQVINFGYKTAEADPYYKSLDAAVFVGDLTDNGTEEQFNAFFDTARGVLKDETELLAITARNHDGWALKKAAVPLFEKLYGDNADSHKVINGYHFIGISTSRYKNERYGKYQKKWLREELAKAAADAPGKPIFVYHHEHVLSTVYGSYDYEGWGVPHFRSIMNKYPQIVHFSGHSHYPLNDPRSVWQKQFTAIGTGGLAYEEVTVGRDRSLHPEGFSKAAQGWVAEVDADNRLRLRGFEVMTGEWLCEYVIDDVTDPKKFAYTPAQQRSRASAPKFPEGADLTVTENGNEYTVIAPAAESGEGDIVFLYRLFVEDGGKTVHTEYKVNNYCSSSPMEKAEFKFSAPKGATVRIAAEDAYGIQSEFLSHKI
ncbi:MAG: metallophosphoesterase [Clostridiales bacterium]|nr:metallophosphoesterase [Clostridiales bacterium]